MDVNVVYDSSLNSASAQVKSEFTSAINGAVQFLDSEFKNPVTITIEVGYGELPGPDGGPLDSDDLGESDWATAEPESYSSVRAALEAEDAPGVSTLPVNSPFSASQLYIAPAEALALGLPLSGGALPTVSGAVIDAYAGFAVEGGDGVSWDFSSGGSVRSDEYYLIGTVEHEFTEDMGRVSLLDEKEEKEYAVPDLYRYSSGGSRLLTVGTNSHNPEAYFSINGGSTLLGSWNNVTNNGDLADWYPEGPAPGGNDSFNDFSNPGVVNEVSPVDITLMEAIGWTTEFLVNSANSPYRVSSGVTDSNYVVVSGGSLVVLSGGVVETTTVSSGGVLILESGGLADPTVILGGGSERVSAGGTDIGAQLSGGIQYVYGYASGATAFSGEQIAASGGTADGTIVSSGGALTVQSGGLADPATILGGGSETVSAGGTDLGARISGGIQEVAGYAGGVTIVAGSQIVAAGGSAGDTTIRGGQQIVSGYAAGTTVAAGAQLVDAGGTANGTTIEGGDEIVSAGGTAGGIVVAGGTLELSDAATVIGAIDVATVGSLDLGGSGAALSAFMASLTVSGLGAGDIVDLSNVPFVAGATVSASADALVITVGGTSYDLALGTAISRAVFLVTSDGGENTEAIISSTSHSVDKGQRYYDSSTSDFADVVHSGGTMIIVPGAVATSTAVERGGTLIIEAGGTAIGLINSGTVDGFGGLIIAEDSEPVINDGIMNPSNGYLAFSGSFTNTSSIVASATGKGGYAHVLVSGGTLINDGSIVAVATSSATQAVINIEDAVLGGKIIADGNAQIYLDGGSISGATLQTIGPDARIGVFGGGTATVTSVTVSKGSFIFDDGALTFSGGTAQANVSFLAYGTKTADAALTLSNTTFGAGDRLIAETGGVLNVSAASGGASVFSVGTLVSATAGGTANIFGSVVNSGTMEAFALGDVAAAIIVSGGTAGNFTNAEGALVEAQAVSGYDGAASVDITVGGAAVNSGAMQAVAGAGYEDGASLTVSAATFTNEKGARIAQTELANGMARLTIFASGGVTNLGAIAGAASHDSSSSDAVTIGADEGPIVNSGTIAVSATTNSFNRLNITDNNAGSLTNAKGADITLSATTDSTADFSVDVGPSGAISNSGAILFAAGSGSQLQGSLEAGAVLNYGAIEMVATGQSQAENADFNIVGSGGGGLTNSGGTIDAIASNHGSASQEGEFFGSGNLLNTGTMQAVASGGGEAFEGWRLNTASLDGSGNFSNTKTIGASATADSRAVFFVEYYASGSNNGTVAATAEDRSEANVYLDNGETFTNTGIITASEVQRSTAQTTIYVYGSGGSGASITNTNAMRAVGSTFGQADLTLTAFNSGATISNTGTITATASAGAYAYANLYDDPFYDNGSGGGITNSNLLGAIADGGRASINVQVDSVSGIITNTKIIEAAANGGTAYTAIGGDGFIGAVVNNTGGTLVATETAGTALFDMGMDEANVSGGTLTTVGANAWLGVTGGGGGGGFASATGVTVTAKSQIVGWGGPLALTDIAGSISAGTLVQAAKSGAVNITGNLSNSGTIEALANQNGSGWVSIDDGTGTGTIVNSGTIKALVTSAQSTAAAVSMSAGTVINAKSGVMEIVATAESDDGISSNYMSVGGTNIVNSGTILASANDSSDDALTVIGGSVTNAATGKIEAIATNQSYAYAYVLGQTTNAGLIEAQGGADSNAGVFFSGTVNNSGGTILAIGNAGIYLGDGAATDAATIAGGTLKTVGAEAAAYVINSESAGLSAVTIASGSVVLANDFGTLTLENGTVIGNNKSGTDAATVDAYAGNGEIVISGTVYNSGALIAGGGNDLSGRGGELEVTAGATVSGAGGIGWVEIDEFGTVNVLSGGSANVTFAAATSGTLEIADAVGSPEVYGGTVAGFGGVGGEYPGQVIELDNGDGTNASAYSASYALVTANANPNLDIGTLTVTSSGGTAAVVTLEGNYVGGAAFTIFNDAGNIGISDPPSNSFFTSSNVSGATIVASATGHDGYAHGVVSSVSLDDTIKAIATSATTQAVINLEGSVDGGSVTADGNAQVYIDGATLSGATLQAIGAGAGIGVFGGGTATVTSATVSKGSLIFDDGVLTFSGGAAQAGVTFLAEGTQALGGSNALTLADFALGGSDHLIAERNGYLAVSAASGNAITFSAGTIVGATSGGTLHVFGGSAVTNFGTMQALQLGGDQMEDSVNVFGGSATTFTNAKGALVEALATSGYANDANVTISAGGAAVNDGTMLASAGSGDRNFAFLGVAGNTFTNEKGATIAEIGADNGHASVDIFGAAGVTNLGIMRGTESGDSHAVIMGIETSGGPIVNSGAISILATTSSYEGLRIDDSFTSGGSLTNAKGASITASAATGSDANFYVAIDSAGTIDNSGTMLFAANSKAEVTGGDFEAGSIVNFGTIDLTATSGSLASDEHFNITGANGGLTNSGGTIEAIASNDSTVSQTGEFFGGGNLLNTGTVQAVATASSRVREGWELNHGGTAYDGNFSNAANATIRASATGDSNAQFFVDYYANGSNSGTITAKSDDLVAGASVDLDDGRTFTNTNLMTASATMSGHAFIAVSVDGSGGASITNTGVIQALGNARGFAGVSLDAYSQGGSVSNSGTITAVAISGALAEVALNVNGISAGISNSNLIGAIADGGTAYLSAFLQGTSGTLTNAGIIEAVANGGTAYASIGADGEGIVNNSGGTLLARETAGAALFDLGDADGDVSGGTLKTVGANAWLGVIAGGVGLATGVTIAAKSQIVGWEGTLDLADVVGSISAGTLVQAAKEGTVNITGDLSNAGTIEALGNTLGHGALTVDDVNFANSGMVGAVATAGGTAYVDLTATTLTNAKSGIVQALASGEETAAVGIFANGVANSGLMLASATGSSRAFLENFGGSVTNTATGKIEAIATDQSSVEADVLGSITNSGLIEASGGNDSLVSIHLSGTVNNSGGTILATGNAEVYLGEFSNVYDTIVSGGTLKTAGPEATVFITGASSATLSDVAIASGSLVQANDGSTLTLENGTVIGNSKTGTNAATVDAYDGGGNIVISGAIYNSGLLIAGGGVGGGKVTVSNGGVVSGAAGIGWIEIDEFGTVDVLSGGSANVTFGKATSGTLEIADKMGSPKLYGGTVAGFGGVGGEFPGQTIELLNADGVHASAYSASYALVTSNANPALDLGTLTLTSGGGTAAAITLEGDYVSGATFTIFNDGGNIGISDPSGVVTPASMPATLASMANAVPSLINTAGASNVALLGNYMASMFVSTEGGVTPSGGEAAQNQTLIAHPHSG